MGNKKKTIIKLICLAILTLCYILLHAFSYFRTEPGIFVTRTMMFNNIKVTYPYFAGNEDIHIEAFFHTLDNNRIDQVTSQINFIDSYINILFKSFYNNVIVDYHSMFFDKYGNRVPIYHIINNEDAIISKIKDYVAVSHLRLTNDAITRADWSFLFDTYDLEIFLTNYNNLGHISLIVLDYNEIEEYLNISVNLRGEYNALPKRAAEYVSPIIPQNRKKVAFSFDDGPSSLTLPLLDILDRYQARASFFMLGEQMLRRPEIVLEVMLRGHEISNHTTDHALLTRLRNEEEVLNRIRGTADIFRNLTGEEMRLFRPPYGGINERVQNMIDMPIILWSVDSRDWESRNTERIVNLVLNEIQDGDIVLFHDLYPTTIEAVAVLLPILRAYNFEIVTVSELFTYKGLELLPGEIYRHAR